MPRFLEITQTPEWREMLQELQDYQQSMLNRVLYAARQEEKVQQKMGQYDGFTEALELLQSFGKTESI